MRKLILAMGGLALAGSSLIFGASNEPADAARTSFVVEKMFAGSAVNCSTPGADNAAFALMGHKIAPAGLTFRINQSTFPNSLNATDVHSAIAQAFASWDDATPAALFTNGGLTNARPGSKDGINSIGFGGARTGVVATAYGWFPKSGSNLAEFDLVLSNNYSWATNAGATGDCGGAAGAFDVQAIVTHEAGHAVGFQDVFGPNDDAQTMFGYVTPRELFKRTLANGDLQGVTAIYGANPAPASQEAPTEAPIS